MFSKNSIRDIIRVSNSLNPDQDWCSMSVLIWVQTVCQKNLSGTLSEYQAAWIQIRTDVPPQSWSGFKLSAKQFYQEQTAWIQIRTYVPCRSWSGFKLSAKIIYQEHYQSIKIRTDVPCWSWSGFKLFAKKILSGKLSKYQAAWIQIRTQGFH